MRIIYVSSSILPSRTANSVHVMKMCAAFARAGHEVILLAPHRKKLYERHVSDLFNYYGVERSFRVIRVRYVEFFKIINFYALISLLVAHHLKPNLVYGRNVLACMLAAFTGLPTMFESHAPIGNQSKIKRWAAAKFLKHKNLKKFIVITHSLARYYLSIYPELKAKCSVAPDCADIVFPHTSPIALSANSERLQVGYVGNLYPGRGVENVIGIASKCMWADFHFVGGNQRDVESFKKNIGLSNNCFFHGFVPPSLATRYHITFDILLAPYQRVVTVAGGRGDTSQWMSPMKIFEYMAARKAIICSNLPVLQEILQHDRNALLCNPDAPDEWVRALEQLRDSQELREKLQDAAYQDFLSFYTWDSRVPRVLES